MVDLARGCGRADLVLAVTRGAAATNGTYLVRDAFPLPRTPCLSARIMTGGPEPALMLAVARQESSFDPPPAARPGPWG